MLRIKKIRARAFRGIGDELTINLGGKSFVLYGDNGTGKSSIVEAIEYALTGHVHSIENRGQRVSLARHGTHVTMQRAQTDLDVVLSDGTMDSVLAVPFDRIPDDEEVAAFLRGCHSGTFILRRYKLLSFIEAVDRDRYAALRPFLGLEQYERIEDGIKQAKEALERKASSAESEAESAGNQFLAAFGLPKNTEFSDKEILKQINEDAQSVKRPEVTTIEQTKALLEQVKEQIKGLGDTSAQGKLTECRSRLQEYIAAAPKKEDLKGLSDKEDALGNLEADLKGAFYEEVLKLGTKWIREDDALICPLCEKPVEDKKALLDRIQARLDEHAGIVTARSELRKAISSARTALREFNDAQERAFAKWKDAGLEEAAWPLSQAHAAAVGLKKALESGDRIIDLTRYQEDLKAFVNKDIGADVKKAEAAIQAMEDSLPKSKDAEVLLRLQNRCTLYTQKFEAILKQLEVANRVLSASELLVQLHERAVEARKQACREIFAKIGKDIGSIYDCFHPGEGLGKFELEVRDVGSGSAILKGTFPHRQEEDPRALYSEAHLDTLGLAVFLALRKREDAINPSFKLIVFDDILTSVDAPHRQRVATYILTELSKDHQVIITTHSRPWYEWISHLQSLYGLRGQFVNKRILDWSFGEGPQIVDMEGDYQFIQNNKGSTPHEITAPVAGRLLENVLQELRYSLKLAVEARRNERYTIGDLWPKFMSTSRKKLKGFWAAVERDCMSLNNTVVLRNWETHSNEWAREISREEALSFIDGVLFIYEKTFCQKCASFIGLCDRPQGAVSCKKGCVFYKADAE